MSNRGNSRQVQVKTSTSLGPNKMTVTRETTYTTKTVVTFDGPAVAKAMKGGNNYLSIKGSGGGGGGYSNNGSRGGGGRRW